MDESQPGRPQEDERLLMRLKIATELLSLAYFLYVMWMLLVPEHRRRLILMQAAEAVRRTAARAAFRTGHQAMGLEASGSVASYELPYRLSLLREYTGRVYEKLRYTA